MHDQFFITLKKHLDERMSSYFKRAPMVLCRGTAKRHKVIFKQLPRSRRKRFKVLLIKLTSISTCFSYLIPRFGQSTTQGLCHKIIRLFLKFCNANRIGVTCVVLANQSRTNAKGGYLRHWLLIILSKNRPNYRCSVQTSV